MKEPQLLQTKAYDYLINLIKKGELETDKIYSLNQLAREAGFSKTPFRDAVLRLEQERYIDILPSRGFTIHKMSKEDIIETYQMRNAIEIYCSKQLALHLDTPSLLNMIQAQDLTALEKLIMHHLDVPQKITLNLIQ